MGQLHRFQQHFASALIASTPRADLDASVASLVTQPGFSVYRNTVRKGCIDALQANYPAVTRLVGEEWMRAATAVFVQTGLPSVPMLLDYGAGFAAFLETFEPAADLPYLPGVARLDRFWNDAHAARDELPIRPARIAALTQDQLAGACLRPHASARWAWFESQPVFTIWSRNRENAFDNADIEWKGEGALIVRPEDGVQAIELDRAEVAFLDACAAGEPIAGAAMAALAADATAELSRLMARLVTAGAFSAIDLHQAIKPEIR